METEAPDEAQIEDPGEDTGSDEPLSPPDEGDAGGSDEPVGEPEAPAGP
jgi:hypothetical protein